uniref:Uncharacterized protein n=2 Tax=Clastoptera arizonana TaxID=38151 RepID=A0A1B6D3P9_9HEMI
MGKTPPDPLYTIKSNMASIHSILLRIADNKELIYASTENGKVHIWNLKTCREINIINIGSQPCLSVNYFNSNFITQEKCGNIKIWSEVENSCWILQVIVPLTYVGFCKFCLGPDSIICPEENSAVTIRSLKGDILEKNSFDKTKNNGNIMFLKYENILSEDFIFILFESGTLKVWKRGSAEVSELKLTDDCPMALDFDGQSRGIIGTSGSNLIEFYFIDKAKLSAGKSVPITNPGVSCVKIRPDKRIFIAGCWDGRLRFFSMKTLKLLAVLDQHQSCIQDVVFSISPVTSLKCKYLCVAGGQDKKITLWNLFD